MRKDQTLEKIARQNEIWRNMRLHGKSIKQIATEAGLSYDNVRVRLKRWERNRHRSRYRLQKGRGGERKTL